MPIRSMPNEMPAKYTGAKSSGVSGAPQTPAAHPVPPQSGVGSGHGQVHKRQEEWIKNFASPKEDPEEHKKSQESRRSHPWLVFMIIAIVSALVLFMMIPVLENFVETDATLTTFTNIKEFISFVAPIIIIVSAIAGTAGYFRLFSVAWFLTIGHLAGLGMFFLTLNTTTQSVNLGVYWIIILSFAGGFLGSLVEFIYLLKKKVHRELLPLLLIGFFAFGSGGFVMLQFTTQNSVDLISYEEVGKYVSYQVYEPAYLPDKLENIKPRMYLNDDKLSVYYGEDHYPPPPVIDFLNGIEIIQTEVIDPEAILDPEPGVVFVELEDGVTARFTERRGRATIEWNLGDTHILMNVYSNISSREMFRIARTMQPALTTQQ